MKQQRSLVVNCDIILDFPDCDSESLQATWKFEFVCDKSDFSQTHKVANIDIFANFVLPYICSLLHYEDIMKLANYYALCIYKWERENCI